MIHYKENKQHLIRWKKIKSDTQYNKYINKNYNVETYKVMNEN